MKRGAPELVYLPLGGAGEIGMNMYLYGFGPPASRQWIIVDCGIGFADATLPGIEIVMPDIGFIEEERANLLGIVLTHAHEDHFGAVATLWPRLGVPVYATPFTAAVLKTRLLEHGLEDKVTVNVLDLGARFALGPFDLEFVTVTHSIPEPNALVIRTPAGLVLHTGDWKIDDRPVLGAPTDEARLRAIGEEGCDVMICDSTNVFREGTSASETDVAAALAKIVAAAPRRVAITTFSSNVARILSLARAAHQAGRDVVVAGRALHRVIAAARATGYLEGAGQFLDQTAFRDISPEKTMVLLTGSQGEYRAALARVAYEAHPHVKLEAGDMVIFSSKTIPGNETAVADIENWLAARGIDVVDADRNLVHVTGHPRREELKRMYGWVRPALAIPMHGEMRHLAEHVRLAREAGAGAAMTVANGQLARLLPAPAQIVDEVPSGRLLRDGDIMTPTTDPAVRERRRLAVGGVAFIAIALDRRGEILIDPDIELIGIPTVGRDGREIVDLVADTVDDALDGLPAARRRDSDHLAEMVRRAVRSAIEGAWGKKTDVRVSVSQV